MRCSLLTLSTYLDGELATDRAAEVDAHLIGCSRCSTGLGYLREEAERIRTLARVQVPDYSTHQLLAEVGLIASEDELPGEGHVATMVAPAADLPPWYSTEAGKALPWDPRHPARERTIIGRPAPAPMGSDEEPELDFAAPPPLPPAVPLAPEPAPEPEPVLEPVAVTGSSDESSDSAIGDPFAAHGFAAWEEGPAGVRNGHGHGPVDVEPHLVESATSEMTEPGVHEPEPELHEPEPVDEPEPGESQLSEPVIAESHVIEPAISEPAIPEPDVDERFEPAAFAGHTGREPSNEPEQPATSIEPPARPTRGAMGMFVNRVRDAVGVRLALMRSAEGDLDDNVQIVSGTGAPDQASYRDRREQFARDAHIEPADSAGDTRVEQEPDDISAPVSEPYEYIPMHEEPAHEEPEHEKAGGVVETPDPPAAPITPDFPLTHDDPVIHDEPLVHEMPATQDASLVRELPATHDAPEEAESPSGPGRHMRSVERGKDAESPPWLDFAALREHGVSTASRSRSTRSALADRRLWAIGVAVFGLLLIGLLVGKSVSTTTVPATALIPPNPTAVASSAPAHASATAAPTSIPTPLPTPPPPPSASKLINPLTLGTGAAGFSVKDLRYGSHPNDFRIVFDLNGPAGSPKVIAGMSGDTTLFVEFENVTGVAPAAVPAGQIVTSVKLLKPSPIAGRTIYEFTLSKSAKLGAFYLAGPTRLVLDLT
jgi:hypothetical protein